MRIIRDIVLVAAGILLLASIVVVVFPFFGMSAAGGKVTGRGVAVAQDCRFSGPITESNAPDQEIIAGWWWVCNAKVHWSDGRTEVREVRYSQLTNEDVGREVDVVEREEIASRTGDMRSVVYRADFQPKPLWGNVTMVVISLLAVLVALPAGYRLVQRVRGKSTELPRS